MPPAASLALRTIGHLLLGGLYVGGGIKHVFLHAAVADVIRARGVPAARFVLLAGTLWQLVAGALLMLGIWVAGASLSLMLFTLIASFMLLDFWNMQGTLRATNRNIWTSNLAIIGGLAIAAASG